MAIMQEIETKLQKGISVSTDEEVYYALLELVKDKAEKKVSNKGKKSSTTSQQSPLRKAFIKQPYQLRASTMKLKRLLRRTESHLLKSRKSSLSLHLEMADLDVLQHAS